MTKTLKIQPVDLVDLTVTTDDYTYILTDFTVSGGFLVGEIDATISVAHVTISSSGYTSQSFIYKNLPSEVVLVAQEVEILSDGTESYLISDKVARANITTIDSRVDSIEEKIPAEASSSNQLADKSYVDGKIPPIAYGTSTSAATTVEKVVSIPEITELNEGQIIVVQPTITSTVANSTIKLNNFDAYPMRYSNAAITTSTDATVWSLNYPSQFVFDGSHWVFLGHGTDTNTTYTINYSIDAGAYKSGIGNYAITRYSLCMQKPDMTWEKVTATTSTYSTGTSKSVNTRGFILGNIRYYNTTAIVANGANTASNTMNEKAATLDFRYSTNCGSTPGYATGDYVYFVGTIGADGLFYLDTTQWWTNTLPTTNDGKLYVQIGKFLADYNVTLYENHPAYYYDGSKLCEYKVADNKQDVISDLNTIRSGATLGASSLQPGDNVSELTNDSGYITGISSSDVTTALGYTPADDDNVVKTSGDQTIDGAKTFINNITRKSTSQSAQLAVVHQYSSVTKGTNPISELDSRWRLVDKDGLGNANSLAGISLHYNTNGSTTSELIVFKAEAGSTTCANMGITYPQTGNAYTYAPTPATSDNSTKIATTAYVQSNLLNYALDNTVVKLTGVQTVGGKKTFTSQVTRTNSSAGVDTPFVNKNTGITKGTVPSANVESRWRLTDSSTGDSNSALIGGVMFGYGTNMRTRAVLQAGKPEAGSTTIASMGIYYPADGDPYTEAPTPASSDNSTKIATTAYVHNFFAAISGYDATKTQTLKNVNGTLTWVTD